MGYLYNSLKKALGGDRSRSSNGILRDWTPNGVRSIVITRNFIFVGYHVQLPKYVPLDLIEVQKELQKPSATGALHNLLTQRQLSCMEEIYVDGMFQNYQHLMNLDQYIHALAKDTSRLRYYGYCDCPQDGLEYLMQTYSKLTAQPDYLFTIASDNSRPVSFKVMSQALGKSDWYKKHYLRPNSYALDKENGRLAIYFKKGEDYIASKLVEIEKSKEEDAYGEVIKRILAIDEANLSLLKMFINARKKIMGMGDINVKEVPYVLKEYDRVRKAWFVPRKGLTLDLLKKYSDIAMADIYKKCNMLSKGNSQLTVEELELEGYLTGGFLKLDSLLEEFAFNCAEACWASKKSKKPEIVYVVMKLRLPEGRVNDALKKAALGIPTQMSGEPTIEAYLEFSCGLCGFQLKALA